MRSMRALRLGTVLLVGFLWDPLRADLNLRLDMPRSTATIEGEWTYLPYDGTGSYTLTLRATRNGFYEFEGTREGQARPVLQIDRSGEGTRYRGEVGERFDGCIPPGARFDLLPTAETLRLEPVLPVSAPVERPGPGPCGASRRYFLSAKGRGDDVRLRPVGDLAGMPRSKEEPTGPGVRGGVTGGPRTENDPPVASMTLGAPSAREGTLVEALGSLRDGNGRLWHHVRVVGTGSGEAAGGDEGAGQKEDGGSRGDAKGADGGEQARRSAPAGTTKGEPPSGYVPAENLAVRWECRLDRAAAREPAVPRDQPPR